MDPATEAQLADGEKAAQHADQSNGTVGEKPSGDTRPENKFQQAIAAWRSKFGRPRLRLVKSRS